MRLRKLALNYVIIVVSGLPNLAITFSTLSVLTLVFHWSGVYALAAYLVGQVFSVSYSVCWVMFTKSSFTLGRWHYSFSRKPKEEDSRVI